MASSGKILLLDDTGPKDVTPFVDRFLFKESLLDGHATWRLWFKASSWEFWADLMVGKGLLLTVNVTGKKDGRTTETGWLPLTVDASEGGVEGTRLRGSIVGGGPELKMCVEEKRKAYAMMPASTVLAQIAALYQLAPTVGQTSDLRNWYQANQTDWEFLQEVMSFYVASSDNRGDAYLYVGPNTLDVGAINYAKPSVRQYDLTADDDRVTRAKFRYYGGQVDRRGGAVVEARGYDNRTGLEVFFLASPVTAPSPALANKLPKPLASRKRIFVTPWDSPSVVRAQAIREQARFSLRYFGVSVKALNDLTVKLKDMFEISMRDEKGYGSANAGRYGVFERVIEYSAGNISTTVVGFRRESYVGEQPAVGAPVSMSSGADTQRTASAGNLTTTTVAAVPLGG